ncbi:MAG: shikimate kinase [candidate division Zixibacteria bacterium]|nr:shikimate kinase [candidate division Zixibacteria bacterium]
MKLKSNIFLIGFSGSGKSTVGKLLAKKLNCSFVDIDKHIESKSRKTILNIFKTDGEKAFRKLESAAIKNLFAETAKAKPKVIALGGGAFENRATRQLISENGISVWLRCSISELYERLRKHSDRPKLTDKKNTLSARRPKETIQKLLLERKDNYARADLRVTSSGKTANRVALEIISKLRKINASD